MRTNINIDDSLLARAIAASGARTTSEVVELGLAALVRLSQQQQAGELRGRLAWRDDLEKIRRNE